MSKMAELSMQIDELVEKGMSAKFIAVTLNVPIEWAEHAIEERMNEEMVSQYECMEYSRQLEDFSPFDTFNS
jgi:orotate phosphoribosyltransferase-like protein